MNKVTQMYHKKELFNFPLKNLDFITFTPEILRKFKIKAKRINYPDHRTSSATNIKLVSKKSFKI